MSLGENSLMAAYQGKGQWEVDHQERGWWHLLVASDGGIRNPTRDWCDTKSNEKETVLMNILWLMWIRYPASQRLIQRQCGVREATDEHFFVQQQTCLALWCEDNETLANAETLSFVISEVGADSTQRNSGPAWFQVDDRTKSFFGSPRFSDVGGSSKTTGNGRTTEVSTEVAKEKV